MKSAASVPSVRAAEEQPAGAVRRAPQMMRWSYGLLQLAASLTLIGSGIAFIMNRKLLQERTGSYGGLVLVLLGLLLLTPLLVEIAARVLQPLARTFLGLEARLAADNLIRSRGRTGLVITAVALGVAIVLQTAGVIRSNH